MNAGRWKEIEQIYNSVLERIPDERAAFLKQACAGDESLRQEVESLLACNDEAEAFIESPAIEAAAQALAEESEERDNLVGRTLLHYSLLERIGEGGMGVVYRAQDHHLNRAVAIKVLPDVFAQDSQRLARFEREARAVAALSHPNILGIYDLCSADGVTFAAMELLEGETLRERLKQRGLPVRKTIDYATQMAQGLAAAHERGIVHRDLKPENVFITKEGRVKILDFGLAKLRRDGASAEEASAGLSSPGMLMGTVGYMSPEQARGQEADARSDIFALGAIFYEMLSGQRAFQGDSEADTISAILKEDPRELPHLLEQVSPAIERVVRRCLEKNPDERFQSARDLGFALDAVGYRQITPAGPAASDYVGDVGSIPWRQWWPWALTAVAVVTAAFMLGQYFSTTLPVRQPTSRFSVITQPLAVLVHGQSPAVALSPDGTHLVYVAGDSGAGQLYVRELSSLEAKPIAGADQAQGPFFSPDGQWIAFFARRNLQKISLRGGSPISVCALPGAAQAHGGCWGDDGNIVFNSDAKLWRVSAEGGMPKRIAAPDKVFLWPEILPGSKAVLATADLTSGQSHGVWVLPLETGQPRLLIEGGGIARYVRSGHLVYASEGSLLAAPFDLESLELTSSAIQVIQNAMMGLPGEPSIAHFAVSHTGTLAYLPGPVLSRPGTPVWVNREGQEEGLALEPRLYDWPRVSPDGSRLALDISEPGKPGDIWLYDLARQTLTRLTFDSAGDRPLWTPDGERVVFRSNRDGKGDFNLFWKAADGTGQDERLTTTAGSDRSPKSFSPDGKRLVFTQHNSETQWDLHVLLLEGQPTSKPLLQAPFIDDSPAISPNGRWLAYRSNETGRFEIYVRPFPDVEKGKWQLSTNGGSFPLWSPDGRELFYEKGEAMMVVAVQTTGSFPAGTPKVLFTGKYLRGATRNFDIAPDGRRFIMIKQVEQGLEASARDELTVVLNWFGELRQPVPTDK